MDAIFHRGNYETVDYTPNSAVTAGDIIVSGDQCFIAHSDIAAGQLGALAADGGEYIVTTDEIFTLGDKVYWDGSGATATASGGTALGFAAADGASGDTTVRVRHDPF